jgi:hypothetical protein
VIAVLPNSGLPIDEMLVAKLKPCWFIFGIIVIAIITQTSSSGRRRTGIRDDATNNVDELVASALRLPNDFLAGIATARKTRGDWTRQLLTTADSNRTGVTPLEAWLTAKGRVQVPLAQPQNEVGGIHDLSKTRTATANNAMTTIPGNHRVPAAAGAAAAGGGAAADGNKTRAVKMVPKIIGWLPISLELDDIDNPNVDICRIEYSIYSKNPHATPTYASLIQQSQCYFNQNLTAEQVLQKRRTMRLKDLLQVAKYKSLHVYKPAGFIYHESRVGSTVLSNMLGALPNVLMINEPPILERILFVSQLKCTKAQVMRLFRAIVQCFSVAFPKKHVFFKLLHEHTVTTDIILTAFPSTPWIFIYRKPVHVLMSHIDPAKEKRFSKCRSGMSSV